MSDMNIEPTGNLPDAAVSAAIGLDGNGGSQLVTFTVADEQFGVDIMAVREIRAWSEMTPLPNAPDYVLGVVNLRGAIVPIVDLRARFGQGKTTPDKSRVVIIVAVESRTIGILVDAVSDILTIGRDQVQPVPEACGHGEASFLDGLITVGEQLVARIGLERLFEGTITH